MTRYGMAIDLSKCMGCRACMVACKMENGTPSSHFWMYTFRFEEGKYPNSVLRYLPRPCMHCSDPPCVKACPKDARIKWKGGTVVTDVDNCTGVRACEAQCPYGVNYFNIDDPKSNQYLNWWTNEEAKKVLGGVLPNWTPELTKAYTWDEEPNKKTRRIAGSGYRQNTVGKCTFRVHRLEKGETVTACQQVCPASAIIFGDLDDSASAVSKAIAAAGTKVFQLKTEANTKPNVYYLGAPPAADAHLVEQVIVKENVQLGGRAEYAGGRIPWK